MSSTPAPTSAATSRGQPVSEEDREQRADDREPLARSASGRPARRLLAPAQAAAAPLRGARYHLSRACQASSGHSASSQGAPGPPPRESSRRNAAAGAGRSACSAGCRSESPPSRCSPRRRAPAGKAAGSSPRRRQAWQHRRRGEADDVVAEHRRSRTAASDCVARQAQAAELPARVGRKEVAVARADVARGRGARAAAQHELVAHELAVVLADRARRRGGSRGRARRRCASIPRRRRTSAPACRRPAPRAARADAARRSRRSCPRRGASRAAHLPLGLGRQARARPAREGVGLVEADVADRRVRIRRAPCRAA